MRQSLGALSHKHCDAALSELRCGWSVQVKMCPYLEISNIVRGLHEWLSGKKSTCQGRGCRGCGFDPCTRKWQFISVFLPGKPDGAWMSTAHGVKESAMTEHLHTQRHYKGMMCTWEWAAWLINIRGSWWELVCGQQALWFSARAGWDDRKYPASWLLLLMCSVASVLSDSFRPHRL